MAVLETTELAGVHMSLILNLYSLTPFITAILFFIVFRERLARAHIVGMILLMCCVVITGESSHEEQEEEKTWKLTVFVPLTLAIVGTFIFTNTNFLSRYFVQKYNIRSA
jgi:drug/metabolite transporter (DMT)-like permease